MKTSAYLLSLSALLLFSGCVSTGKTFNARDLEKLSTSADFIHAFGVPSELKIVVPKTASDVAHSEWTYYCEPAGEEVNVNGRISVRVIGPPYGVQELSFGMINSKCVSGDGLELNGKDDRFRILRNENAADLKKIINYKRTNKQ